jgi:hypothetical protein
LPASGFSNHLEFNFLKIQKDVGMDPIFLLLQLNPTNDDCASDASYCFQAGVTLLVIAAIVIPLVYWELKIIRNSRINDEKRKTNSETETSKADGS